MAQRGGFDPRGRRGDGVQRGRGDGRGAFGGGSQGPFQLGRGSGEFTTGRGRGAGQHSGGGFSQGGYGPQGDFNPGRGRGGGFYGGRGGAPRGGRGGHGVGQSSLSVGQQTSQLSPQESKAADGTSLVMERPIAIPRNPPLNGNKFDPRPDFQLKFDSLHQSGYEAEFPLRKTFADSKTTVFTNHFAIRFDPKMPLYEYNILGLPEKISAKTTRILIQELINNTAWLEEHQDEFVTDYRSRIVSWVKFPEGPELKLQPVRSKDHRDAVRLTLDPLGRLYTQILDEFVKGAQLSEEDTHTIDSMVSTLNLLFSKSLSEDTFSPQPNKFFVAGGHNDISPSLCTMRGYFYSITPGMGQILLNLNVQTSAFFKPLFVSEFLRDNRTFHSMPERLSALRGLRVYLTYEPEHKDKASMSKAQKAEARYKNIVGTGRAVAEQTFELKGEEEGKPKVLITVQKHFEDTYGIRLQDPNTMAINCGTDAKPLWYPAEKLRIVPHQMFRRKVPDHLSKDMIDNSCHPPAVSRALIEHEGLPKLGIPPAQDFVSLPACAPVQIDPRMLEIPAGILPSPQLRYSGSTLMPDKNRGAQWDLRNRKFLITDVRKNIFKVFIIAVPKSGGKSEILSIVDEAWNGLRAAAQVKYTTATLVRVGKVEPCPHFSRYETAYDVMDKAKKQGANFVMLLLETKSPSPYSMLKDLADRTFGLHSLCLVWKGKPFTPQYFGNIAMKMNLKAGGTNHTVADIQDIMKDTLVLGADVTHPSPGCYPGAPSIAAIVGSVDQYGGKFLGSMRLQPKNGALELIDDVEGMVRERLLSWHKTNKSILPKNILYYRDGVSDSQYVQVRDSELPQIRRAFAAIAKSVGLSTVPDVKLTAVVVAKRHNVRTYPQPNQGSKNGNCKPGTLVDSVVTSPYYQEFYLQAHNGLKGTAKPAHYFVLLNEMDLFEEKMQDFTHKLSYTYVRATLPVSYAPPTYYADRLCERGRCYLRSFYSPLPGVDPPYQQKKLAHEKILKAARDKKFEPTRKKTRYGNVVKSEEEKKQEDEDKKTVEAYVMGLVLEQAKKAFYPGYPDSGVRNPWHKNIEETMFWM